MDAQPSPRSDELDEQLLQQLADRLSSPAVQKSLEKVGRRFVSARKEGRYPDTRLMLRLADPETGRQWEVGRSLWKVEGWTPESADLDYMIKDLVLSLIEPGGYYGEDQPDKRGK
jgi:hypothetical protein